MSIHKIIVDMLHAISHVECAKRSLSDQEIGQVEQVVLEHARKMLWRVHDALGELPGADDDNEDEEGEP